MLRRQPQQEAGLNLPNRCPEDESIAAYLDGGLSYATADEIETHLTDCSSCLEHFLAAKEAALAGDDARVPTKIMERAMALMPESESKGDVFNIVVGFVQDSIALIATSGRLILPTPAAQIRGKDKSADISMLQIESTLGELQIGVEIERLESKLCQIVVSVKAADGVLADGLRFSLLSGEREQASYLARQGTTTFDRIPPGEYQLAVTESGKPLGVIDLTIKEDSRER